MKHTPGPWEYDGHRRIISIHRGKKYQQIAEVGTPGISLTLIDIANAHLIAAVPIMKGQLQTGIDVLEAAIRLFLRKEDSEAFAALKGIIAGNEMAIAKSEGK